MGALDSHGGGMPLALALSFPQHTYYIEYRYYMVIFNDVILQNVRLKLK